MKDLNIINSTKPFEGLELHLEKNLKMQSENVESVIWTTLNLPLALISMAIMPSLTLPWTAILISTRLLEVMLGLAIVSLMYSTAQCFSEQWVSREY